MIDVTRLALNKFNAMFGVHLHLPPPTTPTNVAHSSTFRCNAQSVEWIQEKVAMGSFQKEEKLMPAAKKSKVEPKPASTASNNRAVLFGSGRRRGNHRPQPPVPQPGAHWSLKREPRALKLNSHTLPRQSPPKKMPRRTLSQSKRTRADAGELPPTRRKS